MENQQETESRILAENYLKRTQPWHSKESLEYFCKPGNSMTIDAYLEGRAVALAEEKIKHKFSLLGLRVLRTVLTTANLRSGAEVADEMVKDLEKHCGQS